MDKNNKRVGIFVDVQNMYYSAKALHNAKVDFGKVLEKATKDRTLIRAIAYVIKTDVIKKEKDFFASLEKKGYEIKAKDLQIFYGGNKKGDWDIGIAMDIVRLAPKLDVIVLVSGDGDFTDLIKYAKALGCYTEAIAFSKSSSSLLKNEVDAFYDLDKSSDYFLIKNRTRRSPRRVVKK